MNLLKRFFSVLPTFLLSLALAVAVWISAVTSTDPVENRLYPRTVNVEFIGQDPSMVMTSVQNAQVSLRLTAPKSIWDRLTNDRVPVRAVVDLSTLATGKHTVPIQVQVGITPVKIVSFTPNNLEIQLERLKSAKLPIQINRRGEPAVGFEAGFPQISQDSALVSGPESLVNQVNQLQVVLDVSKANDSISRSLDIQPLDNNQLLVKGLTVNPPQITVTQPVTQRGGYRNVVVKVVTTGQVGSGYRLTTISVFPPAVTVFASDPTLVDTLPGYVETSPVDLTGVKDDVDTRVSLNLPKGISVVGDQTVNVVVGIAAIEGSLTLNDMRVEIINLDPTLGVKISPTTVNIILSGPLPLLDQLKPGDIRVVIDLSNTKIGTYQLVPKVELSIKELRVESILPGSIEVTVGMPGTPTLQAPAR